MRLWSLHPRYLDAQGLVALWREALLAQAVLRGDTKGYRQHPQLERFKLHPAPLEALALYLQAVQAQAEARGYRFDKSKIGSVGEPHALVVTAGQLEYEWSHLMRKLQLRSPGLHQTLSRVQAVEPHPLFQVCAGEVEAWERR